MMVTNKRLDQLANDPMMCNITPEVQECLRELIAARSVAKAARTLADAMETCHECKGTVLVEEQPIHCEDCSYDCESHDGAECATIYSLHLALKTELAKTTS